LGVFAAVIASGRSPSHEINTARTPASPLDAASSSIANDVSNLFGRFIA
jgi:hypothetical protein